MTMGVSMVFIDCVYRLRAVVNMLGNAFGTGMMNHLLEQRLGQWNLDTDPQEEYEEGESGMEMQPVRPATGRPGNLVVEMRQTRVFQNGPQQTNAPLPLLNVAKNSPK